jgi:cytochrome c biogenesis protein CcmG, thiol:disulfide interchange protein DsbE
MNRRAKLFIPVAFFLAMAGFLMFGLTRDPNVVPSALVDKPFPEFSLPGLYTEQGAFSRKEILGDILIVNIWGSWCIPCHIEHPFLLEMSEKESDITFMGISYDDSIEEDRIFLEERGNPFDLNVIDFGGSLRIDLGVTGAPETFLVDQNGMILYRHIGAIDSTVWNDSFEPLLEQIR